MDIYPGPGVRKGAIYNEVSHGIIRHYIELIRELKIGNRLSGRRREQTRMRYPARQITAVVYLRKFKKKIKIRTVRIQTGQKTTKKQLRGNLIQYRFP